jgi:DMSO/TMAO reductase YedYZ molybdopterin-dependent catalytic subunit
VSCLGGASDLLFNFLLRVGNIAAFPPESAVEALLRIIPESIQEPSVQRLGDFAGQLALIVASIIAVLVYGILGVIFYRLILPRSSHLRAISKFEMFLLYALVPYAIFGLVLLPLVGDSIFGISSSAYNPNAPWIYPISLLFAQLLFSLVLFYGFTRTGILPPSSPVVKVVYRNRNSAQARDPSRRAFIQKGIVLGGVAVLSVYSLDKILSGLSTSISTNSNTISPSQNGSINLQNAPAIFSNAALASLVDNEVSSNDSFYRVAIDIIDPSVDASTWSFKVGGSVNNPKTYTLSMLQDSFSPIEQYNTFECVSNLINGSLVGNAKWTGVKISDILNDAGGVTSGAQYVIFYSVDGYSVAVPLTKAMMSDSILAYMMNDQPLPQRHGYPLRAVMPGLYGMMSAKFLDRIDVVNSPYQGYWQTRGWSNVGTVQTVSFITLPGSGSSVSLSQNNGSVFLGGMAYAGDRGISKVEVSVDGGHSWQDASLKPPISNLTWALWAYQWTPSSTGNYNIYARATDGTGATQTSSQTDTFPNGATGYAMTNLNITK